MIVIENETASKIVEYVISKEILSLKPVIAGGFIVALYNVVMKQTGEVLEDIEYKVNYLMSNDWNKELEHSNSGSQFFSSLSLNHLFDDIDFWFLENNDIWVQEENILIKQHKSDFELDVEKFNNNSGMWITPGASTTTTVPSKIVANATITMTGGASGGGGGTTTYWVNSGHTSTASIAGFSAGGVATFYPQPVLNKQQAPRRPTFHQITNSYSDLLKNHYRFGGISNSTSWANSFPDMRTNKSFQFIKKPYSSVDKLFADFDLINCCAAYHDGKFYFHDDFIQTFKERKIKAGLTYEKPSVVAKIWAAQRTFKYARRYFLEFEPDICQSLVQIFMDMETILQEVKKGNMTNIENKTIDLNDLQIISEAYGKSTEVSVEKLIQIIYSLLLYFPDLIKMKNFEQSNIFMFLNSQELSIKNAIELYFKKHQI